MSRAKKAVLEADLIIYVVDSSSPLDENDFEIMEMIKDKRAVILLNKSDLPSVIDREQLEKTEALSGKKIISVSAKEETGLSELKNVILDMFYGGKVDFNDQVLITNLRQKDSLSACLRSLSMVMQSIDRGLPEDFYSIDLTDAYSELGHIIGEAVEDDVVNEIFSKFCTGK